MAARLALDGLGGGTLDLSFLDDDDDDDVLLRGCVVAMNWDAACKCACELVALRCWCDKQLYQAAAGIYIDTRTVPYTMLVS